MESIIRRLSGLQRTPFFLGFSAWLFLSACSQDIDSRLARGQASFAAHEYRAATIDALSILDEQPDHVDARLLLGYVVLELGNYSDAARHLEMARDAGAPVSAYAVPLSEALANTGDVTAAFELLNSVPDGERTEAHRNLYARLLVEGGRLVEAEALLASGQAVSTTASQRAERRAIRASILTARGDARGAEAEIAEALQTDANNPEIWALAGAVARGAGSLQEAAQRLQRAAELFSERQQAVPAGRALLSLVRVQLALGLVPEAGESAQSLAEVLPDSPAANIAMGLVALQQGDSERAIDSLRRAANAVSGDAEVLTLLGAAYLAAGNLGQAEQQLINAVNADANPQSVRLLAETRLRQERPGAAVDALEMLNEDQISQDAALAMLLGAAHLEDGDLDSAITILDRALSLTPDNPALSLMLARAYVAAGRSEEADAVVDASPVLGGDVAFASKLAIAMARFQSDGSVAARQYGDSLVAEESADAESYVIAAALDFLAGDTARARGRVETSLQSDPDFIPARLLAASLEAEAGRIAETQQHLEYVLTLDPYHESAAIGLARFRMGAGDIDRAQAVLRAARTDRSSIRLLSALGDIERRLGNGDAVQGIAAELKERFPTRAAGYRLEGDLLADRRQLDAAWPAYRTAFELEPDWGTLQAAVRASRRAGSAEWETLLRDYIREMPDDLRARLLLAENLQTAGRNGDALAEYEAIVSRDTQNPFVLNNLAWLAHEAGRPGAVDYARRAKTLAPDDAAVLDTLGWLLTETGRADEGLPDLERASELASGVLEIRYHLAVAQARTGRSEAARGTLEGLLAEEGNFAYEQEARDLLQSL